MLMITENRNESVLVFKLAGMLASDWVVEFDKCWRNATSSFSAAAVTVDLSEVTYVDETGRDLLSEMVKTGAELIARDLLMKSIVEEIRRQASQPVA